MQAIGIRQLLVISADLVITNSIALVTSGLSVPVAANQQVVGSFYMPITVGATGGLRAQLIVPAGGVEFAASFILQQTSTTLNCTTQLASAAFTNALASAGNYMLMVQFSVKNGATAGTVDLQIAQNTADVLSLTLQASAYADIVLV